MEFHQIIENNVTAIIAGIFTILGTIIGWGLTQISKKGKLKLVNVKNEISEVAASILCYQINLFIYNSSDNIISINDLEVEILAQGRKYSNLWINTEGKTIEHFNFNPKQITKLTTIFNKQFETNILSGDINKIIFTYREKGKRIRFIIYRNVLHAYLNSQTKIKYKN